MRISRPLSTGKKKGKKLCWGSCLPFLALHPSQDATHTTGLGGVGFHETLDKFPEPLTFQSKAAFSHSNSQIQKSIPYFLGKLPVENMSANGMFSLILNRELTVTSVSSAARRTSVTSGQRNHFFSFSPHQLVNQLICRGLWQGSAVTRREASKGKIWVQIQMLACLSYRCREQVSQPLCAGFPQPQNKCPTMKSTVWRENS